MLKGQFDALVSLNISFLLKVFSPKFTCLYFSPFILISTFYMETIERTCHSADIKQQWKVVLQTYASGITFVSSNEDSFLNNESPLFRFSST